MDFTTARIDPTKELRALAKMWKLIFPHDKFFGSDVLHNSEVEAHWIILSGGKVGFTIFQMHASINCTYDHDVHREFGTMYILIVGLIPTIRSRGLGTKIKQWQIDHARKRGDIKKLVSNHRRSNTASYKFNIKAGYREVGIKPNFYPSPAEDSIVMEFVL